MFGGVVVVYTWLLIYLEKKKSLAFKYVWSYHAPIYYVVIVEIIHLQF